MKEKSYRWVICAACTWALFCTGGLLVTGFNVYTPYLISVGGLSNAEVSVVIMVRNLFSLSVMFLVVPVIRRVDIRLTITLALFIASAAFLLFGQADAFPVYCAAAALSGLGYGLGGMVPVSVLIKRWFTEHGGLALGICASGTGLSAVIGAPILTAMIETRSMRHSLRMEAGFLIFSAALLFVFLRDYPNPEKREEVRMERRKKTAAPTRHRIFQLNRGQYAMMILGVFLCGMSYNSSPFLTALFREKGFDAATVGWLSSFMGAALCVGKCVYGAAVDTLGRVRAGNLFYTSYVAALFLCAVCIPGSQPMAYTAMALLGLGFPMLSVGLSELAAGTAREAYYADAVKQLQILYMIGSISFGIVPGVLADLTGEYRISYYLFTVIALSAALFQQIVLKQRTLSEE